MAPKIDDTNTPKAVPTHSQTIVIAIILSAAWLVASFLMYDRFVTPKDANAWDHALVIYNGLSSVGFSAIGVLLGTQVQQTNVAAARRDVAAAKQNEAEAKTDAATTRAVAKSAVKAAAVDTGGGAPDLAAVTARLNAVRNQLIDIL